MLAESRIEYVFVNGLGDGQPQPHEKLVQWLWRITGGPELHHYSVDWFDDESFESKRDDLVQHVNERQQIVDGVVLIGSSAAGSLVFNCLDKLKDKNVCAVSAHGRLSAGNYPGVHKMSLHKRAHLGTERPAQAFHDSVVYFDKKVRQTLTPEDKRKMLILTQLTDMVVPLQTMLVDGVETHRSIAFGHTGGFLAHFIADKGRIVRFGEESLS